ncbi:MAG: cytidine deaminase family protein [Ktedonobacterales bacterium]
MGTTTADLIKQAASVVRPQWIGDRLLGDVGCALLTDQGQIYRGVCLDTGSGTGFCAETSAIAAMVTAGEVRIKQIVAVWKDENGGTYILSPCGRCRELIRQLHEDNLQTAVVLGEDHVVTLSTLLPHPNQFTAIELSEA